MVSSSMVQPLTNLKAVAGESPLWSESEQALYWVDIKDPRVLRYSFVDGSLKSWPMPSEIGAICHAGFGCYVVSLRGGVTMFDPRSGGLKSIAHPETLRPTYRLNETKIDRNGRLWVGSVEDPGFTPEGHVRQAAASTEIRTPNLCGLLPKRYESS
jgi:sugar lactone lactonase YvrE